MWQGLPNINKVKQYEILLFFKVSLLACITHSPSYPLSDNTGGNLSDYI